MAQKRHNLHFSISLSLSLGSVLVLRVTSICAVKYLYSADSSFARDNFVASEMGGEVRVREIDIMMIDMLISQSSGAKEECRAGWMDGSRVHGGI